MSPGRHRNSAALSVVGTLLEDSVPNNGAGLHLRCTFQRSPTNPPASRPPTSWMSKWQGHPRPNEARFPERMQCFHRVPGKSGARKPGRDCTSSYAQPLRPRRGVLDFLSLLVQPRASKNQHKATSERGCAEDFVALAGTNTSSSELPINEKHTNSYRQGIHGFATFFRDPSYLFHIGSEEAPDFENARIQDISRGAQITRLVS